MTDTKAQIVQLTESDVQRMARQGKHAEIEAARVAGRLNAILGVEAHPDDAPPGGQIDAAQIQRMFAARKFDEIEEARKAGLLTNLLGDPDAA